MTVLFVGSIIRCAEQFSSTIVLFFICSAFQVRLENKAIVHSGIVCLSAKTITVLGGSVSSLYEEWQMNKKYSGFSRSTLKQAHEDGTAGPPPFEKLQIGALHKHLSQQKRYSGQRRDIFF